MKTRLSVCYAAPGHALVSTSGATRNILSLADKLSEWVDLTIAFRRLPEAPLRTASGVKAISIEDAAPHDGDSRDDEATRGVNPVAHLRYWRSVRGFADRHADSFDLVLEKGWRLSGLLLSHFAAHGVPGAVIENDARCWTDKGWDARTLLKWLFHMAAQRLSGHYCRQARLVIAETKELKEQLVKVRKIPADKIRVAPLGVDLQLFHPMDQALARRSLQFAPDKRLLLYIGGMDKYHDLTPLIDALAQGAPEDVELHVVGDGEFKSLCEAKARLSKVPVVFHGRVAHEDVPRYIAASDLCLAPYRAQAFYEGVITFSTLKIPEYMACARPVASIPSGEMTRLITQGVSGFLFANTVAGWHALLADLPDRRRLRAMGLAARVPVSGRTWRSTALAYLEACSDALGTPDDEEMDAIRRESAQAMAGSVSESEALATRRARPGASGSRRS